MFVCVNALVYVRVGHVGAGVGVCARLDAWACARVGAFGCMAMCACARADFHCSV